MLSSQAPMPQRALISNSMHIKEYISALFHGWVGRMSGIASVILTFLPFAYSRILSDSKLAERLTWVAAAICFLIANYAAWLTKRNELEREKNRHIGADIRGTVKRAYLDLENYSE